MPWIYERIKSDKELSAFQQTEKYLDYKNTTGKIYGIDNSTHQRIVEGEKVSPDLEKSRFLKAL